MKKYLKIESRNLLKYFNKFFKFIYFLLIVNKSYQVNFSHLQLVSYQQSRLIR